MIVVRFARAALMFAAEIDFASHVDNLNNSII